MTVINHGACFFFPFTYGGILKWWNCGGSDDDGGYGGYN